MALLARDAPAGPARLLAVAVGVIADPRGTAVGYVGTTGVETLGVDTDGVATLGSDTAGVETFGTVTVGSERDGTVTGGVETDGTVTDGVETDGTVTDGVDTDGTVRVGVVTALLASGSAPITATTAIAVSPPVSSERRRWPTPDRDGRARKSRRIGGLPPLCIVGAIYHFVVNLRFEAPWLIRDESSRATDHCASGAARQSRRRRRPVRAWGIVTLN
jgi:hypothetical protein